ncbi:MAG: 30S ribosomal protein S3 [Christensenellales bacterium]|jgi:small subunit ribosomal protein S3
MGQKVHPHGARVGIIKDWDARWFAGKKVFADYLMQDNKIRIYLKKKLYDAGISRIEIERREPEKATINITAGKPGIIIGRGGVGIEEIKKDLQARFKLQITLNIYEVRTPDADAQLVAESIAAQLERRISFRRAVKQSIMRAMRSGAKGIKCIVSGRIGGAEIARTESYHEGSIPLQTLRADIDYGFAEARTTYGRLGCKVWIYKGEIMPKTFRAQMRSEAPVQRNDPRPERRPARDRRQRPARRSNTEGGRR